ncbi:MAG: hypothetical protein Q8O62_08930 [Aequorivita sp.]|nr:hypothetical protein [Aequorivita sp.]
MKAVKIILGIILIIGPIITIPKLLDSGNNIASLLVPIIFLILGILLIRNGLKK